MTLRLRQGTPGQERDVSLGATPDQVFVRMSEPESSVGLPPGQRPRGPEPIVTFSQEPGSTAEPAASTVVYINEVTDGRSLRVSLLAPTSAPIPVTPGNAAQPDASTPIAAPRPRKWMVSTAPTNVPDSLLGQPALWSSPGLFTGSELTFTTSRCGLDRYVVTTWIEGQSAREHLVIELRKRISVEHIQVARPPTTATAADAGAPAPTHFDLGSAFTRVLDYLADNFGIDSNPVQRQVASTTVNMTSAQTTSQTRTHLGVPSPRAPRTIYVAAAGDVRARSVGHPQGVSVGGYGDSTIRTCAISVTSAERLPMAEREQELFVVAMHEIGHVFDLVASNPAPDLGVPSWMDRDPTHNQSHCDQPSCIMWWEGDAHASGRIRGLPPTDIEGSPGRSSGAGLNVMQPRRCWLWLLALDLST